jgi:glutamyl-tRNA synthetase
MIRTRFAPSPTGELHPGNARIAVLNWLYARHSGGRFILRIEDTDADRMVAGAETEIMASLKWLGLDWDEGPDVGGPHGPYRQSERLQTYNEAAKRLLYSGHVYSCYCTPEELEERKQAVLDAKGQVGYDGRCRDLSPEEEQELKHRGLPASLRFIVPGGEALVEDVVRGTVRFDASEFGDFVIIKSDGLPTYNFAVVVDDSAMEISHVIRGAGHLTNTARQLMLYQALGDQPPVFVHVPHVLAPDGAALSKRHGARSLREYMSDGYHPDALVNYLSLLSWSSPSGDEVLPPERLVKEIDLERLRVSDARLDPEKLDWLSGEYIRQMEGEELAARLADQLGDEAYPDRGSERVRIATAIQERINTYEEARRFLPQFYPPDPMQWDGQALESLAAENTLTLLEAVRDSLVELDAWDGPSALTAVRNAGKRAGFKGRALFMPVRACLTGTTTGPEIVDILEVQGKDTALRVVNDTIARLLRDMKDLTT